MKAIDFPLQLKALIGELRRLPGVGPRSAERIAIWALQNKRARPLDLASAIIDATESIRPCGTCGFFTSDECCQICEDEQRDRSSICVVEQATDVIKIEQSGSFKGLFHCLGGKLSPLDNVGPEDLKIHQLLKRVDELQVTEVILAVGSDVEGEATANYLIDELSGRDCQISRIAQGLPAGGGLDHADELTLLRAMNDRKRL